LIRRFEQIARAGLLMGAAAIAADHALSAASRSAGELIVCHAGSVSAAFAQVEQQFTAQHGDVAMKDVSGGSVALAARLASGVQPCDIYAAADYQDIDLLLEPAGVADYTIVFAKGRMVLAYIATDPHTNGIAAAGEFKPPASIPQAAADWYKVLLAPGVRISSSHPFLDPSGYRTYMIFRLTQAHYNVPNLANALLEHVTIAGAARAEPGSGPTLGKDYDFQFIYEHSAAAAAKTNPSYRYVSLPDRLDLSTNAQNPFYAQAFVSIPGVAPGPLTMVTIPATPVAWGLTIPKQSRNQENAVEFVSLLLGPAGTAALTTNGPTPITPALVSAAHLPHVPPRLRPKVVSK